MCYRYATIPTAVEVKDWFQVMWPDEAQYIPQIMTAPTDNLPVITASKPNVIQCFRFGLIPSWAKDTKIGLFNLNARSETLLEKPSFKKLVHRQRCIAIASAYYDWKTEGKKKTLFKFWLKEEPYFGMAALWDAWLSPEGELLPSFSIITTRPNALVAPIHHRMPVLLNRNSQMQWLDIAKPFQELETLLQPYEENAMLVEQIG